MIGYRMQSRLRNDVDRLGGLPFWLSFRCLPALLLIALLLLLTTPGARAVPRPPSPELDLNGLQSGQLLLRHEGGSYRAAVVQRSEVDITISGMIATVTLQQTFRNDSDRWMEGVYGFPLPDNAAVRALEMVIGERRIVGKVREKMEAKRIYQQAKKQGKKASLVEQQRPNLFTNRVANIAPGESILVRLEYVQQVNYSAGVFSLRFPMTITPRYMPGTPQAELPAAESLAPDPYLGWAVPTDQVPDADAISPQQHPVPGSDAAPLNPIEIRARLDMGMPLASVDSPYHEIAMTRRAGVYEIALANGVSEMDRDFVLDWRPVTGAAPAAAFFSEQVAGEYYGLLMLVPPGPERVAAPPPREIVFVVDTSGSMGGASIEQARESVRLALGQLRPQDFFNVIEFNSRYRALFRQAMPASRHNLQYAGEFVRHLRAYGGTEMLPALQYALSPPVVPDLHREQLPLRQVVFITDGAVGNERALFEAISDELGDTRLFTVGIGSAPNSWFMRRAAQAGRGSHTHIGDIGEVSEKMDRLFEQLSRPAVVDLQVDWPAAVEAWPRRIPDLYLGEPLLLAVKFGAQPPSGKVSVAGSLANQLWLSGLQLSPGDPGHAPQHPGVASIWARAKITGLLDDRAGGDGDEAVRAAVLEVALAHQLLSPYTSFIAVEEVVSRPAGEEQGRGTVANTRPRGQSPQTYAYPRTATTAPARAWFAALALFLALMIAVLRREEVDDAVPLRA